MLGGRCSADCQTGIRLEGRGTGRGLVRPQAAAVLPPAPAQTFFEDAMGSCERILRTPIPLSYTRHTSRFL